MILVLTMLTVLQTNMSLDIRLKWDPSAGATGYKVYQGTASGQYGPPIDAGNVTEYTVKGLAPGRYYFAVTAYNATEESGHSNEVNVLIAEPSLISQVLVTYLTTTSATISWTTLGDCSGTVEYGLTTSLGKTAVANNLGTTDHIVTVSGLITRTHYYYKVKGTCAGVPYESSIRSFNTK